jgi:hypothetical protein
MKNKKLIADLELEIIENLHKHNDAYDENFSLQAKIDRLKIETNSFRNQEVYELFNTADNATGIIVIAGNFEEAQAALRPDCNEYVYKSEKSFNCVMCQGKSGSTDCFDCGGTGSY